MIQNPVSRYCVYCLTALLPLLAPVAVADAPQAFGSSRVVMIDEDYFSCGANAELDKRIEGDAALVGGRIAVRGPVKGDVILAGGDINIADTVGQDLYAAGGGIALSSQVAGNARIAGGQVTVSHRGGIAGKATIAAASVQMAGRVGRYLAVYAESVRVEGEVGGDLRIVARSVEIGPEAKIGGKLIYRSQQLAKIEPTAAIAGGVTRVEMNWPGERVGFIARAATWISLILLLLGFLLVGAIIVLAFPVFSASAAQTLRSDPWKSLGLGFSLLLCLPVAAILFTLTVIGIPLGVALLLFYPVMLLLGYITGALFLGDRVAVWVAKRRALVLKPGWRYVALAATLFVLLTVYQIPYVGCILEFLLLLLGLGAFWICAYRGYAKKGSPQEPGLRGLDLT